MITIIGSGKVGAAAALFSALKKLDDQILLLDIVKGLPQGEAMDLNHMLSENNVSSSWNSTNNDQGLNVQTPAYVNQAHISTYYQDNPWSTINFSKEFDVTTLGGDVNAFLPPGHRPGNVEK